MRTRKAFYRRDKDGYKTSNDTFIRPELATKDVDEIVDIIKSYCVTSGLAGIPILTPQGERLVKLLEY